MPRAVGQRPPRLAAAILGDIVEDLQLVLHSELDLARVELTTRAESMVRAGAVLGISVGIGMSSLILLFAVVVLRLCEVMRPWQAASVAAALGALCAVGLFSFGLKRWRAVRLAPAHAIRSIKADMKALGGS